MLPTPGNDAGETIPGSELESLSELRAYADPGIIIGKYNWLSGWSRCHDNIY